MAKGYTIKVTSRKGKKKKVGYMGQPAGLGVVAVGTKTERDYIKKKVKEALKRQKKKLKKKGIKVRITSPAF